jgi:23S rRNA pseudouridine1911/1915/1917 synthase
MQALLNDTDIEDIDEGGVTLAVTVTEEETGKRIDVVLTAAGKDRGLSRTRVKSLVEDGRMAIDGVAVLDANHKVKLGQEITLVIPPALDAVPQGETVALDVVYEDDHLIVIDKPAGLVVHPAPGHYDGTLVNALIGHCGTSLSGIGGVKRPGIVHRLDKDTSGLLVVAKTDAAHRGLSLLFADHGRTLPLLRSYRALVWNKPARLFGTVNAPLGRHPADRQRMAVVLPERGREAITHWKLEETFGPDPRAPLASLITCNLETGRTHQIRVHMAHIGHPVLGDALYARGFASKSSLLGAESKAIYLGVRRQALHAAVLGFEHPVTGEMLEFKSPFPPDLARLHEVLRTNP